MTTTRETGRYFFAYQQDNGAGARVLIRSRRFEDFDAAKTAGQEAIETDGWALPQIDDTAIADVEATTGSEYEAGLFLHRVNRAGVVFQIKERV